MDASVLSDDSDYDIVDASIADLHAAPGVISNPEPPPSQAARETFNTCHLSGDDIQTFVQATLGFAIPTPARTRTKRVYVDGVFDGFNVRHALQLRQAKLAFPSVWLVVGVFSAQTCELFGARAVLPEVERGEMVRHCRWVDEVLPDAPCTLDAPFLQRHRIDYVAVEEGATVDPAYDKLRLKGYDEMKRNGIVILTRRTTGVVGIAPPPPVLFEPEKDPDTPPDFTAHIDAYGIGY